MGASQTQGLGGWREPFTFGVALTPKANARDWSLIEALLGLTLRSALAQTEGDLRVLIAGHDRPRLPDDPRVEFLPVDWPPGAPDAGNGDSGRKKHWLAEETLRRGGGLFMPLDADDWVDRRLVETARATIGPEAVGGLVRAGEVVDARTLRAAPLPHPEVEAYDFHRFCGSSGIVRLRPDAPDSLRRNPFEVLRSHHEWLEVAAAHGATLADLPVSGAYLVNTSENHSETHGPYAAWRAGFTARVNAAGRPLSPALAARFGLPLEAIRAVRDRFFAPPGGAEPGRVVPLRPVQAHSDGRSATTSSGGSITTRPAATSTSGTTSRVKA